MKKILFLSTNSLKDNFIYELNKIDNIEVTDFLNFSLKKPTLFNKISDKYLNIFYRVFLKDKMYYEKIYNRRFNKAIKKRIKELIRNNEYFDYAIFSRGDKFEKILKDVRVISEKMIEFHADTFTEKEPDKCFLEKGVFDKVFCFDPYDAIRFQKYGFLFMSNCMIPYHPKDQTIEIDSIFLGQGTEYRISCLNNLHRFLAPLNKKLGGVLMCSKYRNVLPFADFKISNESVSYYYNLELVSKSEILIDITSIQLNRGLTFRFFESLYFQKKLITNNEDIKNYDFYNKNNIFITDFNNFDGLKEFLDIPYEPIDDKIIKKYSLENWINVLTDSPKKQTLSLEKFMINTNSYH